MTHCSSCRIPGHNCRFPGHNRLTRMDQRLREFETDCSIKCQTMRQFEFKDWLTENYGYNTRLLKAFTSKKCHNIINDTQNISLCVNAITQFIYNTYKYQHVIQETTIETEPIENDFEQEMIRIMTEFSNQPEEQIQISSENMFASLSNDYRTALLFLEIMDNIHARRTQVNNETKKFEIESIIEPLTNSIENTSECCICFESYNKEDFITLGCNHEFCNNCLKKTLLSDNREKPCCACCRTEVSTMISRTNKIHSKMSELIA